MTASIVNAERSPRQRDWLLTSVWWLLTALMVICLALGVAALLAYPIILANKAQVIAALEHDRIAASDLPRIGLLGVLVAAVMVPTYLFLRHLRRIVASVSDGRPFDRLNADRLRQMAWLSLAAQVLLVPMTRQLVWFDAFPQKPNVHHNGDGISMGGIVLVLTLFILARVFRTGSDMREELEGTV